MFTALAFATALSAAPVEAPPTFEMPFARTETAPTLQYEVTSFDTRFKRAKRTRNRGIITLASGVVVAGASVGVGLAVGDYTGGGIAFLGLIGGGALLLTGSALAIGGGVRMKQLKNMRLAIGKDRVEIGYAARF